MRQKHPLFNLVCTIFILASWTGVFLTWWKSRPPTVNPPLLVGEDRGEVSTPTRPSGVTQIVLSLPTTPVSTSTHEIVSLPSEINLSVPFTSQAPEKIWTEPWQDACEEAAVLMVDAYNKGYNVSPLFAKDEILKMVTWEEMQGFGVSIDAKQVRQLIEFYSGKKVSVRLVEDPSVEEIKTLLVQKKPVLVLADGKVLPNPHFTNGGPVYHALIIRGYTEDSFITNDPGTQFGENFVYKYDDLMNAMHEWNNGDVKNGERVVLVVD